MNPNRRQVLHIAGAAAAAGLLGAAGPGYAQGYPERPVRLVIPYGPGGPTDVLGRLLAEHLRAALGQNVIADNRPGGGGVIAMTTVANAPADGYTLLFGDINLSVSPSLHKSLAFDPVKDFTPIALTGTAPMLVLVPGASPARGIKDIVDEARAKPGSIAYAHGGIGSPTHLVPEVLKSRYGVDLLAVSYKGSGDALVAVAGGEAQLVFTGLSAARALIQSGKLRPVAITGERRARSLPDVPTLAEAGVPLAEGNRGSWWGLIGPAKLPAQVVERLDQAVQAVFAKPEVLERLAALNIDPTFGDGEAFGRWIADERNTWSAVLRQAGIGPE